jgi:AsmA protein
MEKLDFTSLQSQYAMKNGVVALNGALDSSLIKLKPEGTIAVDGPLDISLDARLSPVAMSNLGMDNKFKQAMTDENGWGVLPLKFEGTVNHPEIALDSKALQKQVVGKAEQAIEKQLLKKLSHNKNGQQGDQSDSQLLNSTLNTLFGK